MWLVGVVSGYQTKLGLVAADEDEGSVCYVFVDEEKEKRNSLQSRAITETLAEPCTVWRGVCVCERASAYCECE